MKVKYLFLLTLTCATLALAGCVAAARSYPDLAEQPPEPRLATDWQPCTIGGHVAAQCSTLTVDENRAAPTGRQIVLQVAVVKARSTEAAPDPIFWLAGGPGAAASDDAQFAMQLLGAARQQRDIVFVDQRGTGGSHKLTCKTVPVGVSKEGDARATEEMRTCLAGLDGDPAAYTTAWGMDDLDDVRAALGYERINLYGGSYGPTAAQVYIQRHEAHVRTATLTGASLLEVPMFEWMPRSSQHALEVVFRRCEADAACHAAYPELRAEFAEIIARLDASPVDLPLTDPATGRAMLLTRADLSRGLHSLLTDTETQALVPRLLHSVYTGDWRPVAERISRSAGGDPSATWQIMNLTILCHEDWAMMRRAETAQVSGGSFMRYEDMRRLTVPEAICATMPRPEPAALYGALRKSTVPILFLTGEADPQDPEANVAAARARYPNSRILVAPGQAHNYTGTACRASIIADFIESGSPEALNAECLDREPLPPFDGGGS